jgi:SAM-dependent methyltransferase
MNATRQCEVCGSAETAHLYEVDGFPIVRCRRCGLVFVERVVTDAELIELYDEHYYEDAEEPGYDSYELAEARKRHQDRTLLREIESLHPPGDLLEIGCAYGYFLDEARACGWRVRGVEPSAHAARAARERFALQVSEDPFAELPVEPESQDAIVLWDVIEHLPNPRQTLERARQWLRSGSILALSTGDVSSLSARVQGADWSLLAPPWHQFYFSRATIRRLLEDIGFETVRIGGDGNVAVDAKSSRPRLRGPMASVLQSAPVKRVARRLGTGSIMFVYARPRS